MTRETKAGIVVSSAFLALVGAVVMQKYREGKEAPAPDQPTPERLAGATTTPVAEPPKIPPTNNLQSPPSGVKQASHEELATGGNKGSVFPPPPPGKLENLPSVPPPQVAIEPIPATKPLPPPNPLPMEPGTVPAVQPDPALTSGTKSMGEGENIVSLFGIVIPTKAVTSATFVTRLPEVPPPTTLAPMNTTVENPFPPTLPTMPTVSVSPPLPAPPAPMNNTTVENPFPPPMPTTQTPPPPLVPMAPSVVVNPPSTPPSPEVRPPVGVGEKDPEKLHSTFTPSDPMARPGSPMPLPSVAVVLPTVTTPTIPVPSVVPVSPPSAPSLEPAVPVSPLPPVAPLSMIPSTPTPPAVIIDARGTTEITPPGSVKPVATVSPAPAPLPVVTIPGSPVTIQTRHTIKFGENFESLASVYFDNSGYAKDLRDYIMANDEMADKVIDKGNLIPGKTVLRPTLTELQTWMKSRPANVGPAPVSPPFAPPPPPAPPPPLPVAPPPPMTYKIVDPKGEWMYDVARKVLPNTPPIDGSLKLKLLNDKLTSERPLPAETILTLPNDAVVPLANRS